MAISKASRVTEAKRHFVVAIDEFKDGKLSGVIFHMGRPAPINFGSVMDLVWIVEEISDELSWPVSLMKQRQFKKVLPIARKAVTDGAGGKVRRGKLATLKMKLSYRNYASWQGVAAWVEKEETKAFRSFLELIRYVGHILDLEQVEKGDQNESLVCNISVDDYHSKCLGGRVTPISKAQPANFRSVLELAKNLDSMMVAKDKDALAFYPLEKHLVGAYYTKGKKANFVVKIRFCEHMTWQGTVFWGEMKQTVNFRSFLELVKLMDMAVLNSGLWAAEEKSRLAKE